MAKSATLSPLGICGSIMSFISSMGSGLQTVVAFEDLFELLTAKEDHPAAPSPSGTPASGAPGRSGSRRHPWFELQTTLVACASLDGTLRYAAVMATPLRALEAVLVAEGDHQPGFREPLCPALPHYAKIGKWTNEMIRKQPIERRQKPCGLPHWPKLIRAGYYSFYKMGA
eukprot:scaffold1878_cov258-Pinguiococcus_pyrenoidosus.AAC.19